MKRAKRERVLSQLYADLENDAFDAREYAMFQLALMMRRSCDVASTGGAFEGSEHLSRDQLRVRLSSAEQEQIAARLLFVASRRPDSRATAFWALGEASSLNVLPQVWAAVGDHGGQAGDEAALQACRALQRLLEMDDLDNGLLKTLMEDSRPLSWLKRWSRSTDGRLAKSARTIIGIVKGLSG